jgi:hypothetical protein
LVSDAWPFGMVFTFVPMAAINDLIPFWL